MKEQSIRLQVQYERWRESEEGKECHKQRRSLPIAQMEESLKATMINEQVAIVCGETGSGKSTQVPQMLLEHALASGKGGPTNILCTQPRRIAATSLARRVASERGEKVGEGMVGYQVRLESKRNSNTRLLFCTTGIALRMMLSGTAAALASPLATTLAAANTTATNKSTQPCIQPLTHLSPLPPTLRASHADDLSCCRRRGARERHADRSVTTAVEGDAADKTGYEGAPHVRNSPGRPLCEIFRRRGDTNLERPHLPGRGVLPGEVFAAHKVSAARGLAV